MCFEIIKGGNKMKVSIIGVGVVGVIIVFIFVKISFVDEIVIVDID